MKKEESKMQRDPLRDNERLQASLQYEAMGFSVLPVGKDKKPFIAWQGLQSRRSSKDEITAWFRQWPDANIGIVTGVISGIAVIDVDEPKEAKPVLDELLPASLVFPASTTPSGGQHLYFKCTDTGLSNNTKVIPGCDLRANGGYVVAPPSSNERGGYCWMPGRSIHDVELSVMPQAVVEFLRTASSSLSFFSYKEACPDFCPATEKMFAQGRRDNDLFHVANHLVKSRMPESEIYQVLEKLALSCSPPFDLKEIPAKIESALRRAERREVNIAELVERYIIGTDGDFSGTDVYKAVQHGTGGTNRDTVKKALIRLCDKGIIRRSKDGVYRRIEDRCDDIDFLNAPDGAFDIQYPFGIENYVITHPGNIVVVAGTPNAGKTALLLNVADKNQDRHDIVYFSSEMGAHELKDRLSKFQRPLASWKVSFKERSTNFADVIRPDSINIIDYLELHDEFWKVGGMIKEIFDKLKKGIAIVALQKNSGKDFGLGGERGVEKARLYLSMDNHKIRIEKGKNWARAEVNPNGLEAGYKLVNGCEFTIARPWGKKS